MTYEENVSQQGGLHSRKGSPDWWLFFTKFLRHGTKIAAFVPSSPWMAQGVVKGIDFSKARCVLELGAGTGPITSELLKSVKGSCRVLIVERDPDFCKRLRERFPDADIAEADALNLDQLLAERKIASLDHVFCGLPLPSFSPESRDRVLDIIARHLSPAGTFRQLTHMPWVYYPLYRRYFTRVDFHMVFRNLPPAGFYVCRGPRAAATDPPQLAPMPGIV
jgi:phospholipid N-methyltransferase